MRSISIPLVTSFITVELGNRQCPPVPAPVCSPPAKRERRIIGERTRLVLQATTGGKHQQSAANQAEALRRAEELLPIMNELAELSARATAAELDRRRIPTPSGRSWAAIQVIRVRERLELTLPGRPEAARSLVGEAERAIRCLDVVPLRFFR
jgi:hypothetical protein